MLNNLAKDINTSSKMKILLIISVIFVLSNSMFLNLAIITLIVMILVLYNRNVKFYINILQNTLLWLILIQLIYIIIVGNVFKSFIFVCKSLLIIVLISTFILTTTFSKIHSGFEKKLTIFKFFGIDYKKLAYNLAVYTFSIKYLLTSKLRILELQNLKFKTNFGIKKLLIPSFILSIESIQNLKRTLLISGYSLKKEKGNFISNFFEMLFVFFLILVIINEVIL